MTLNTKAIQDALVSHALSTGYFESVLAHEPLEVTGTGITCAIWLGSGAVLPNRSGLDIVSASLSFNIRLFTNTLQQPQDGIDIDIMDAFDGLMTAYSGDFSLGNAVSYIDLMNISFNAGYVTINGTQFRLITISLPIVSDDLWTESE